MSASRTACRPRRAGASPRSHGHPLCGAPHAPLLLAWTTRTGKAGPGAACPPGTAFARSGAAADTPEPGGEKRPRTAGAAGRRLRMRGRGRALGLAPAGASSPPLPSLFLPRASVTAGSRRRRRCFFHGRSPVGPSGLCRKVFVTSPYPKRLQRHGGDEIDAAETAGKWRPLG